MSRPSRYPAELRQRAVRMVAEVRPDYDTEWVAMKAVAAKLGIGTTETLRKWVWQDQVDAGPAGDDDGGVGRAEAVEEGECGAAARERDPEGGERLFATELDPTRPKR